MNLIAEILLFIPGEWCVVSGVWYVVHPVLWYMKLQVAKLLSKFT
jgi:hypothetical protein